MSELWYFDALDAIAGSGFASFRVADLGTEQPDQQAIAVHIDAPFFQPVPIASRALAFAAARGSHQLGLFIDKDEVGFRTLEELTEFVRRADVSSGGGDGGGGGGPTPPGPGPEGEGGPTLEWPIIEGETTIMLLRAAQEFSETRDGWNTGVASRFRPSRRLRPICSAPLPTVRPLPIRRHLPARRRPCWRR